MNTISQAVAQSNANWLASMGLNFSFSVASVPPDVVANLVSGKVYADNWQFSKRIWGDYRSSKGDVSNIVARGIAENKSAFEIAQDLEKYVSPSAAKPWDWSRVYPGCKKKIDYNAQRLARTLSAHAYQQSVIETAKRNPFTTRVEWHSAMVERTCPICEARNGQIYELNKVPMDHPNGLCCIYPVLDKSLEDISNILADWVNGEGDADMNGRIDKYISYLGYDPGKVAADTLKAGSILKGLDKIGGSGIIDINVDEFVPCLKDAKTGEILETEIARMNTNDLSKFNEKTGWGVNWSKRPKNEKVYGVFLKGDSEPQGLISLRNDKGGTYIGFASTAPHNNKQIVGDNQKYLGVGGHLFALAVEDSVKNGGYGTIYGYAANKQVLDHYIQKFGAIHIPIAHEYQFIIEGEASQKLLDIYNYERRKT